MMTDEVRSSDHEHGAIDFVTEFILRDTLKRPQGALHVLGITYLIFDHLAPV
jgi:hypothetical protein